MIDTIYPKKTYLTRSIYAAILLVVIFGGAMFMPMGKSGPPIIMLVATVLLAFLSMKVLSEVFNRLTGLSFFLSIYGLLILFVMSLFLSFIIGPLYLAFNVVQYFRAPN